MRRTPVPDHPDDRPPGESREALIARGDWSWSRDQPVVRGNPRYWQGSRWQQQPRRRRSNLGPLFWLLRAVIGLTILASIWLLLQHLFPLGSPPPLDATPAVRAPSEQAATASDPLLAPDQDQPGAAGTDSGQIDETAIGSPAIDRNPAPQPPTERTEAVTSRAEEQPMPPALTVAPTQAPAAPAPTQAPPTQATPTAAPVPPPAPPAEAPAPAAAPPAVPTDAPPPAPTSPPAQPTPAPPPPLVVEAVLSPTEPTPRNTLVTVMVVVTAENAPIGGAACTATVAYRTATDRIPPGGFATGPDGIGSFTIESRGASFNFAVLVTVTCSSDGRTASAETRFTPRER